MDNRQRILEAAGRIYAEGGFRGATTRRIADEAGVNEVTLFRLFGSKAQLIAEAVQCTDTMCNVSLPDVPNDAWRELTEWCGGHLDSMRQHRGMIRKTLADLEEHPDMGPVVCEGQKPHFKMLVDYASKLAPVINDEDHEDLETACSMLFGSLFADAMGRDVVPNVYPHPEHTAAERYVRVFLRALGIPAGDRPGGATPPAHAHPRQN